MCACWSPWLGSRLLLPSGRRWLNREASKPNTAAADTLGATGQRTITQPANMISGLRCSGGKAISPIRMDVSIFSRTIITRPRLPVSAVVPSKRQPGVVNVTAGSGDADLAIGTLKIASNDDETSYCNLAPFWHAVCFY